MARSNALALISDPYTGDPMAGYKGAQAGNALYKISQGRAADALTPAAFAGDKNALARLTEVDFDRARTIQNDAEAKRRAAAGDARANAAEGRAASTFNRVEAADKAEKVARVLFSADTPEKFTTALTILKAQGVDTSALNFEGRQSYIDQSVSVADQFRRGVDLAKIQADAAKAAAEAAKPLSPEGKVAYDKDRGLVPPSAAGDPSVKAQSMLDAIDNVLNDKNRSRGTGVSSMFNWIPASGGRDFQAKVDQLKGKAFLEAFESLKGGGAITQVEGDKATAAIARLDVAQSEEAFEAAMKELRDVVRAGLARSRGGAGAGRPAGDPGAASGGGIPAEARQAPDGNYYVPDPNRPGKYLQVNP